MAQETTLKDLLSYAISVSELDRHSRNSKNVYEDFEGFELARTMLLESALLLVPRLPKKYLPHFERLDRRRADIINPFKDHAYWEAAA